MHAIDTITFGLQAAALQRVSGVGVGRRRPIPGAHRGHVPISLDYIFVCFFVTAVCRCLRHHYVAGLRTLVTLRYAALLSASYDVGLHTTFVIFVSLRDVIKLDK